MPSLLVLALHVRDGAGLEPAMDPPVPRLEPAVGAGAGAPPAAAEQWSAWWRALLGAEVALRRAVSDGPGGMATHAALAAHHVPYTPPDFSGLDGSPELRELVAGGWGDAHRWTEARSRELHAVNTAQDRRLLECDVVRDAERRAGRRARPFRLYVSVLPVAGASVWRVAEDHVLAGWGLYASSPDWRRWLDPVVEELV